MTPKTIFGREPATIVGLIESALALAVALGLHMTNGQVGLIVAATSAVLGTYIAWVTHDTLLGAVVGLLKAVFALAIGFGLHLSPELTAAAISFVTVALSLFNRSQTYPTYAPPEAQAGAIAVSNVGTV